MKQAFVQVHFIKFAPLKAAKPRLDFILLPPAEVGSWQDPPGFSSCSLSRAREGEGSMLRDHSYTNGKALGTVPVAAPGCAWPCQPSVPSAPHGSAQVRTTPALILVGGRHRDPLKCCPLHPTFPLTLALCWSLDYFHSGQLLLFSLQ